MAAWETDGGVRSPAPGRRVLVLDDATLPANAFEIIMNKESSSTPLDLEVLKQFRLIFQLVRTHFQSVEAQCDISGAQLWALSKIAAQPGLRVTELAKELAVHQSTASNLVEDLVSKGYAIRERSSKDMRVVMLAPTESGYAVLRAAPQPSQGRLPDALAQLDEAALTSLHQSLALVLDAMKAEDREGMFTLLSEMK